MNDTFQCTEINTSFREALVQSYISACTSPGQMLKSLVVTVTISITLLTKFVTHAEKRTLPNSFFVASITLLSEPDKDSREKENYRLIFL